MHARHLLPLLSLLLILVVGCDLESDPVEDAPGQITDLEPTVILVSIDGLRWDYLELHEAPTLAQMRQQGASVERLIPVFPTKTFPNHFTLVTGLYPANHGIVSNNMYDPEMDESFSLGNRDAVMNPDWWEGEPLWVTAEKQGQRAATFFWPGSEAPLCEECDSDDGYHSHWRDYDGDVPGEERVDQVLEWLDQPAEERPTFITLYFSKVDTQGHRNGPESDEVAQALLEVDGYMDRLLQGLEARGVYDQVHLLIASDHGMSPTTQDRVVFLDDHIDLDDVQVVDYDPVAMISPREDRTTARAIIDAFEGVEHVQAVHRDELPDTLHFRNHPRIPEVIILADDEWRLSSHEFFERDPSRFDGGAHGYDPRYDNMHTLLIAHGPSFEQGSVMEQLSAIHVYDVMAAILGLEPTDNDGSLEAAMGLFRENVLDELEATAP